MLIEIGTAGCAGLSYEDAFQLLNNAGIQAMEVEFTHGVRMKPQTAQKIKKLSKKIPKVNRKFYRNPNS